MANTLLALFVFGLLIVVHEFGHFVVAKGAGVRVDEFAIGMGPRLLARKRGETTYSLRILPFGGFVKMAGTDPRETSRQDERGFNSKPLRSKMAIIAAGPFMNFLLAVALFMVIFSVFGVPQAVPGSPVIGEVMEGYPAASAGLRPGDRVLEAGGRPLRSWNDLVAVIQSSPGRPLPLLVERDGKRITVTVTPVTREDHHAAGFIGVAPRVRVTRFGLLDSLWHAVMQTVGIALVWFKSIVLMIGRRIEADVAGPVGIISMLNQASRAGLANLISLSAALSAILGLINLLPIPALDGSRLMFLTIEGVRGKPIDPEKENMIHFVGFAILMILALAITYRDFLRLLGDSMGWR